MIGTARWIRAAIRMWSWIKWPVIVVTGVLVPAVIWGAGIEPRLTDEVQVSAALPGLPDEWSGAKLALIADLQIGM